MTSDIQIEIEWYVDEFKRYETDKSADADNIIKPIIDALTGPEGIMVDDCQVQSVVVYWRDRYGSPEHIEINTKYEQDALFFKKQSISFVKFRNNLCLPIDKNLNPSLTKNYLDAFENGLRTRAVLRNDGWDYYSARGVMPIQRVFHVSRCHGFLVRTIEELRQS